MNESIIEDLKEKIEILYKQIESDAIEHKKLFERMYNNKKELELSLDKLKKLTAPVQEL